VNYIYLYGLVRDHGQDGAAARLLPLSVDGLIVTASLVQLHQTRYGQAVPGLARVMLWLGIIATASADIVYGARYGLLGAVISAWPAVVLIGTAEMVVHLAHRSRASRNGSGVRTVVPSEVQEAVRAAYTASVQAGAPLSQRAMAARFSLSRRKIRQIVPESTGSVPGFSAKVRQHDHRPARTRRGQRGPESAA